MDEFRKWLEEQLERADGAKRGSAWVPGPDPNDVRSELLTDLLEEYDDHHPPRRDTPMTVDEVEAWAEGVDWLPNGLKVDLYLASVDYVIGAYLDGRCCGDVFPKRVNVCEAPLLPVLDRICRETGWGGE